MAKYRFEQIAINSTEKKKPVEEDRFTYLGLEHLDSGSLKVTRFGSEVAPIGEKLVMHKGDVLFGKRRAYQKKVAIAPFDGIFSAHGMVLRPREDVIDKSFFPLFISSDYFLDAAIKISVGSLSPTINWRDLKTLEFELPDLATQRKLAETLWSINETMEAYKKLISATDELVKSQFFGEFEAKRQSFNTCSLIAACENDDDIKCGPFGTQLKQSEYTEEGVPLWGIPQVNAAFSIPADTYVGEKKALQLTPFLIQPDDIAMSRKGNIGQCALYPADYTPGIIASDVLRIRPDKTKLLPSFLMCQFHYSSNVVNQIEMVGNGQIMKGINVTKLKNITIYIPPMELQEQFAAFVRQSDKSKFAAQSCSNLNLWSSSETLIAIQNTIRSKS